jgi:hypothetical protein
MSPFLLKLSQNYFTVCTVLHAHTVNHKKWVNIAPESIYWKIPPGEYQSMSFGGKNMKKGREKGENVKEKGNNVKKGQQGKNEEERGKKKEELITLSAFCDRQLFCPSYTNRIFI